VPILRDRFGEREAERCSLSWKALGREIVALSLDEVTAQQQAKPAPALAGGAVRRGAPVVPEQVGAHVRRHVDPGVRDRDLNALSLWPLAMQLLQPLDEPLEVVTRYVGNRAFLRS
jgi:hypothetical protein